ADINSRFALGRYVFRIRGSSGVASARVDSLILMVASTRSTQWRRLVESRVGDLLTEVEEITEGGSVAMVAKVITRSGYVYAFKHCSDVKGAVDGHDLESFRAKVQHQRWLLSHGGEIARRYPVIRAAWDGDNWSAVLMDWHDGVSLMENLMSCRTTD